MTDSFYCAPNKKSSSGKWLPSKTTSSRWRHMSNLAAASIKESQGSSASSKKMDTFLVKMPESTASWTTLWEKVR